MKNYQIIAVLISTLGLSQYAMADAKNFEGFNIQAGTGYQSYTLEAKNFVNNGADAGLKADSPTLGSLPLMFGVGYTAAMSNEWTLGAVVEYNPIGSSKKTANVRNANSNAIVGSNTLNTTSHTAFSLVPGYVVDANTLVYGKLGYVMLRTNGTADDGSPSENESYTGYQLGLGVKQNLMQNLYGFVEANYISLRTENVKSASDPNFSWKEGGRGYSVILGVGYKF